MEFTVESGRASDSTRVHGVEWGVAASGEQGLLLPVVPCLERRARHFVYVLKDVGPQYVLAGAINISQFLPVVTPNFDCST